MPSLVPLLCDVPEGKCKLLLVVHNVAEQSLLVELPQDVWRLQFGEKH